LAEGFDGMSLDEKIPYALTEAPEHDSPFIPGTKIQLAWDSVSLTSILSCPRRYQLSIIEGRMPKGTSFAIALSFGILFHFGLEQFHKARFAGMDFEEAQAEALKQTFAHKLSQQLPTFDDIAEQKENHDADEDDGIDLRNSKVRTRYHLARAIIWYLEQYGADDPCKTLALPSGAPAVEVSFRIPLPLEIAGQPMLLCGHIDRVVEFNDNLYVTDYKTTKALTRQFFEMFELSHQMTGYSVAGNILYDRPTKGIIVDGLALQVGGVKCARHITRRTGGQLKEYFDLLRYVAELAQFLDARFGDSTYPLNTASCYFCQYKSVCSQAPEFRQGHLDMHFERDAGWNPLANR
jgi:hypothetical protein